MDKWAPPDRGGSLALRARKSRADFKGYLLLIVWYFISSIVSLVYNENAILAGTFRPKEVWSWPADTGAEQRRLIANESNEIVEVLSEHWQVIPLGVSVTRCRLIESVLKTNRRIDFLYISAITPQLLQNPQPRHAILHPCMERQWCHQTRSAHQYV